MTRSALFLVALVAFGALASPPAYARTRSQTVAGWRIVWEFESGDRTVHLRRRGRGYSFAFLHEYWRGNGGVVAGGTFERGSCRSGDAGVIVPFDEGMTRRYLDARVSDYLRDCPLPRAQALALRRTLDAAWPRFIRWSRAARAEMDAENRAIMDYGR